MALSLLLTNNEGLIAIDFGITLVISLKSTVDERNAIVVRLDASTYELIFTVKTLRAAFSSKNPI